VTLHPGLHLLPRREGDRADALDGEGRDRVRETRRRFEIVPVGEAESETGAEGVARSGLIYHFVRREAPDLDLPPAA
jgi:hypothetical protein